MRLRWRLTLRVVGVSCLLNLVLLSAYYFIFVYRNTEADYELLRQSLRQTANNIAAELEEGASPKDLFAAYEQQGIRVMFENAEGKVLLDSHLSGDTNSYTVSVMAPVEHESGTYFVEVAQVTDAVEEGRNMLNTLLWGEAIILPMVLAVMGVYLYTGYIRPLELIQKEIKGYRQGVPLKRQQRSDEFGELHNTFVEMTERIETERQMQNRIIASISHDIKTPLTSVMGYTEQLRKPNLPSERRQRYIDTIYERSADIRNLIDEFDVYLSSHLQSGLSCRNISAGELCRTLQLDYEEELSLRGIAMDVWCRCPNASLWVDLNKMDRVFGNIIGNSVKHIGHEKGRVDVLCETAGDQVRFTITDNGEGVAEEHLGKIFDALYTSDESRSVAGLGLAICKEIVEAHGGTITAYNRQDGKSGLVIAIELPMGMKEA